MENGDHVCELSNSDALRDPLDLMTNQGFIYRGTKVEANGVKSRKPEEWILFWLLNVHYSDWLTDWTNEWMNEWMNRAELQVLVSYKNNT